MIYLYSHCRVILTLFGQNAHAAAYIDFFLQRETLNIDFLKCIDFSHCMEHSRYIFDFQWILWENSTGAIRTGASECTCSVTFYEKYTEILYIMSCITLWIIDDKALNRTQSTDTV